MTSTLFAGIAHRLLRPLLGIVDPLHVKHMPKNVAAFSGFDVLWSVPVIKHQSALVTISISLTATHWSHTQLYLILNGHHVPQIPCIAPPTRVAILSQTYGQCMPSKSSEKILRGKKTIVRYICKSFVFTAPQVCV